jgi:hypothetical protein
MNFTHALARWAGWTLLPRGRFRAQLAYLLQFGLAQARAQGALKTGGRVGLALGDGERDRGQGRETGYGFAPERYQELKGQ